MSAIGPGDVVVCVDAHNANPYEADIPVVGRHYRVDSIVAGMHKGNPAMGIRLVGMRSSPYKAYLADRFRKIDRADDEFTALIRKRKPVTA